ncbi:MAG: oxygen-independent coproporphyrinogen III oxidase [Bacteroidales bacterium]|nr:oxygen-independent coproporphyrinogen III oxidase [Bacteroidales bacterium]
MEKEIILKYNQPGPRYTSYPPANYFGGAYNSTDFENDIVESNNKGPSHLSFYFHVPYCPRLCYFCGCNTSLMKRKDRIADYFSAMQKEIDKVASYIDSDRLITQIHWGGGTPNSVPLEFIGNIMNQVRTLFKLHPDAEIAMECSPAYLSFNDIDLLAQMGFNRMSLGIQDFNETVLSAVNRLPSRYPVEELIRKLRSAGFSGINLDLIYGLPLQNPDNFALTVRKAIEANPDRLVTFSYAHVPWVNKNQIILEKKGLPSPAEKLEMFLVAHRMLVHAGYFPVGLDHYAKKDDELVIALNNNQLHRNFQGYCTKSRTGQVYAFGSSSISQLFNAYAQNTKYPEKYIEKIRKTGFATERGYRLSFDEMVIREVINEVMCNGHVDFSQVADHFDIPVSEVFDTVGYDPGKFTPFIEDGLIELNSGKLRVTPTGMLVVRNIAMKLDPRADISEKRFSKTL